MYTIICIRFAICWILVHLLWLCWFVCTHWTHSFVDENTLTHTCTHTDVHVRSHSHTLTCSVCSIACSTHTHLCWQFFIADFQTWLEWIHSFTYKKQFDCFQLRISTKQSPQIQSEMTVTLPNILVTGEYIFPLKLFKIDSIKTTNDLSSTNQTDENWQAHQV